VGPRAQIVTCREFELVKPAPLNMPLNFVNVIGMCICVCVYYSERELGERVVAENHSRTDGAPAFAEEVPDHPLPELVGYGPKTCRECPGQ